MVLAIVQARMGSSRLPGKVMQRILGKTLLAFQLERLSRLKNIDRLVVATGNSAQDDTIQEECRRLQVECFRGDEQDVLARYYHCARAYQASVILRVTSDCPFVDPGQLDKMLERFKSMDVDYLSNNRIPSFPHGMDAEIFRFEALEKAHQNDKNIQRREHVTYYLTESANGFRVANYLNELDPKGTQGLHKLRWTVDYPEDFEFVKAVIERIYPAKPNFTWIDIIELLKKSPELREINSIHINPFSLEEVRSEYLESSREPENYQKLRWGSEESLMNRLRLAKTEVDWSRVKSWLDVGCGTGEFFKTVLDKHPVPVVKGIELTQAFGDITMEWAKAHNKPVEILNKDFMECNLGPSFHLVTAIGVAQKCGYSLKRTMAQLASFAVEGGQVLITTKNLDWTEFQNGNLSPEPSHAWFHLEELESAFASAGIKIHKMIGLLPKDCKTCLPRESHTVLVAGFKSKG